MQHTRTGIRATLAFAAAAISIAIASTPAAAADPTYYDSGHRGCAPTAPYGYISASSSYYYEMRAPGSNILDGFQGGTHTIVAKHSAGGQSKSGGGNWEIGSNDGPYSSYATSCRAQGY